MPRTCLRSPPSATRPASCWACPSTWTAARAPARSPTRAFARNFSQLTTLAIALWDERLSTAAVERELIGMDVSRARRAQVIDEHAAIFILQGALDRLANMRTG